MQKNEKESGKTFIHASIWFTICNVLQRGIQFIVTPIYTRVLLPEGYGRYSLFLTWCNLFGIIATLSLSSGVFNKAMTKFEQEKDKYLSSMLGLALASTGVVMVIYFSLYSFLFEVIGLDIMKSIMMFVCIYFQMVIQLWSARQRFEYRYKGLIIVTFIFSLIIPTVGISLCYLFDQSEMGLIIGYTLANFLIGSVLLFMSISKSKKICCVAFWKYALLFNLPLIPHYLSNIILGQSDRLMISYFCGDYYAGLYTLAYQVSLIMSIVSNGIENAITPWIYKQLKKCSYNNIRRKINSIIFFSVIPYIIIIFMAPEIVAIIGGPDYSDTIQVIPPVVVSTYIMFINMFLVCILFYFEKNINVMFSTTMGAIINVVLNMLLLPQIGYRVAAYTTVIGYLMICFVNFVFIFLKLRDIGKKIYNLKLILLALSVIFVVMLISTKLYIISPGYRGGAVFVICILCYWKREFFTKFICENAQD